MTGATIKRDLRTGRPLWADSPGLGVRTRALTQAISVDVAVVGAGISGAFMAHELARDHSVAVLDRRPPVMGSTLASTAMLQWEIDLTLTDLSRRIGADKALRAYLRSRAAVDDLKQIVDGGDAGDVGSLAGVQACGRFAHNRFLIVCGLTVPMRGAVRLRCLGSKTGAEGRPFRVCFESGEQVICPLLHHRRRKTTNRLRRVRG